MGCVRVISSSTIQAPSHNNKSTDQKIVDLTPWDLQFLPLETIQHGLLFQHPTSIISSNPNQQIIPHLKHSLSSTLAFFPPLAGRLLITEEHEDNNNNNNNSNTASCFIACNNVGALFVHAAAENTGVADILRPNYVPPIVRSFFPLNGVENFQGTSQPLLAVQVTELLDGIFIGCSINHVVADGESFWHFVNSWAEISRGRGSPKLISKLPSLERWFPNGVDPPLRFPFTPQKEQHSEESETERIFHFPKDKIEQLKSKANSELASTEKIKISSLQALLTHVWSSVIRCNCKLLDDPQEEVRYALPIGVRPRMNPPLPEGYFGNAMQPCVVTMKAGELLLEDQEGSGLGKGAWEMNKVISLHSDGEMLKNHYEGWCRTPRLLSLGGITSGNSLATSSSPRFNVYNGNDFGWGKPVAVRSGGANKRNGKITVFAGAEQGSVDVAVCLPYHILEAMGKDPDFMDEN